MTHTNLYLVGVVLASAFGVASAQAPAATHVHGAADKAQPSVSTDSNRRVPDTLATTAYRQAAAEMHSGMDFDYTNDADIDFMTGMIAHHEGAIAMAKIGLAHGRDPVVRKLSEDIIAAQADEIRLMREWLAKRGH
ncbi:MAG: DUF305 domain-containing protein [Burkholderiaceae bacterium]|nr:DUF305 domain-containing protein [Burkholderiaceae bacterium]